MTLHQINYIFLRCIHFENIILATIPMEVGFKLTNKQDPTTTQKLEKVRNIPYQSTMGNLMYCMAHTYLHITFAIGVVFQFLSNPRIACWKTIKHNFRYLKSTLHHGLKYY